MYFFLFYFCARAGVVAEYDPPAKLLENKASLFAKLVAEYSVRSTSSFENSINL